MPQSSALTYAARPGVVAKYAGQLCLPLAVIALAPCLLAVFAGEYGLVLRYAGIITVLVAAGFAALRLPSPGDIQTNEAYAIIVLLFTLVPAIMAFALTETGLSYLDAYCTAVSASTTTGLQFAAGAEGKALPLSLAWMQWYGGLGILIFSIALFLHPGKRTKKLAAVDMPKTDLLINTRAYARIIILYYTVLTASGIIACCSPDCLYPRPRCSPWVRFPRADPRFPPWALRLST